MRLRENNRKSPSTLANIKISAHLSGTVGDSKGDTT